MNRRDFFKGILISSSLPLAGPVHTAGTQDSERPKVIDAHCHAGRGINYAKNARRAIHGLRTTTPSGP